MTDNLSAIVILLFMVAGATAVGAIAAEWIVIGLRRIGWMRERTTIMHHVHEWKQMEGEE